MPMRPKKSPEKPPAPPTDPARWIDTLALILLLAVVIARGMMLESLRDPFDVTPGSDPFPRSPGAATGLFLDFLCALPAFLLLARAAWARRPVRKIASAILLAAMAAWALLSTFWAGDKFAAIVLAAHLAAGVALFWAAAQLVQSWTRLRLVAGVAVGMLLVFAGQGIISRYVDQADLRTNWLQHKDEILKQRGWTTDSFAARQFEQRVMGGELAGFTASPNAFAALLVLTSAVAAGALIQRAADGDEKFWLLLLALTLPVGIWILKFTDSRAGYATAFLAACCLLALWRMRAWAGAHSRGLYAAGAGIFVFGTAALVAHGVVHHSLPQDSLNFRWKYWVASAHLFQQHPLLGVGWGNFGEHYLKVRLPEAAEEIKDPHNFAVKAFTELGLIGGLLILAWTARLWWELTQPPLPPDDETPSRKALPLILAIALAGVGLDLAVGIDWQQIADFVFLEVVRRTMFMLLLFVGLVAVIIRSMPNPEADRRAGPWIVYGCTIGLGMFLIHNLIEFSLFEAGPMVLFMAVAGAVVGIRTSADSRCRSRPMLAFAATMLAAGFLLAVWVATAEGMSQAADDDLRQQRAGQAAEEYAAAYARLPINADYAFRAAKAYGYAADAGNCRRMLDVAVAADPYRVEVLLYRAAYEMQQGDGTAAQRDLAAAVGLNPNDVSIRLTYAQALQQLGDRPAARAQYEAALRQNDQLDRTEPKRLSKDKLAQVQAAIDQLR